MRKVICDIEESGKINVKFIGDHLVKRELLRLLKAIRLKYRERIRMYRSNIMAEKSRTQIEVDINETNKLGAENCD